MAQEVNKNNKAAVRGKILLFMSCWLVSRVRLSPTQAIADVAITMPNILPVNLNFGALSALLLEVSATKCLKQRTRMAEIRTRWPMSESAELGEKFVGSAACRSA